MWLGVVFLCITIAGAPDKALCRDVHGVFASKDLCQEATVKSMNIFVAAVKEGQGQAIKGAMTCSEFRTISVEGG